MGLPRNLLLIQASKYSAVGVLNTVVDAAFYFLLTQWLGLAGAKILAKAISYSLGTVNSFLWNRAWTFRSKGRERSRFALFAIASLAAVAINSGAMWAGLELLRLNELVALILATVITLAFNFSTSKFIVFKERSRP